MGCHPCDLWSFNYTQFLESTVMAEEEAKQKEALNATLKEYIAEWRKTREKEEEELKKLKEKQAKRKEKQLPRRKKRKRKRKRRRKRRRSKSNPRSAVCTSFTFQKQTRNTRNKNDIIEQIKLNTIAQIITSIKKVMKSLYL